MKMMVGYRGEEADKKLLERVVKRAESLNGTVLLVTSMEGGKEVKIKEFERAEEKLEKAKGLFEKRGLKAETKLLVRGLTPGEDLVKCAREAGVDEIIIRVKNRSKVGKFVFGSTAQFVILEAGCPVLSVK